MRDELQHFQPDLAAKPQIVAANKMDAVDDPSRVTSLEQRAHELKLPFFRISAATGEGIPTLLEGMWQRCRQDGRSDGRPLSVTGVFETSRLAGPRWRALFAPGTTEAWGARNDREAGRDLRRHVRSDS